MPKRFPPIPKVVRCPGGDVPVSVVSEQEMKEYADPNETLFGYFHDTERYIKIVDTLSRRARWNTLYHEWCHAVLRDSGLTHSMTSDGKQEEAICDAVAAARMAERFG